MPTAAQLISQIADETGLDATSQETAILRGLNRAARRIASQTDCLKSAGSIAGDGSSLSVSLASLTGLLKLDSVHLLNAAGVYSRLVRVSHPVILDARPQSAASMYAYEGSSLLLDGPVATTDSLYVRHTVSPTAIVQATTEANVTAYTGIPVDFHEDLLAGLAMTQILEGYEGDEERAAYYRQLAGDAMTRFRRFLTERGGDELQNARFDAGHFHTPSPIASR